MQTYHIPGNESHVHMSQLKSFIQRICPSLALVTSLFLMQGVVSPMPNPKPGGPSLVDCPLLLIHFIRSYPP
jgi:hypothetical protein